MCDDMLKALKSKDVNLLIGLAKNVTPEAQKTPQKPALKLASAKPFTQKSEIAPTVVKELDFDLARREQERNLEKFFESLDLSEAALVEGDRKAEKDGLRQEVKDYVKNARLQ
jgi:hypothetical protein